MPVVEQSSYEPPCLLRQNLVMYFWANTMRWVPRPPYEPFERVETPPGVRGSFFELAWWRVERGKTGRSVALIAPGLSGGAYAKPTRGMARALHEEGWDVAVWVYRDTGKVPTRVRPTYSGYGVEDLNIAVNRLRKDYTDISLVGLSLGGNIVIQYVCAPGDNPVSRSVAISPPIAFGKTVEYWSQGVVGRLGISRGALSGMKRLVSRKVRHTIAVTNDDVHGYKKVRLASEADHFINSEFNQYPGAWEYWQKATTSNALRYASESADLLILTAKDDPLLDSNSYPYPDALADGIMMELTTRGSHISFVPRGLRKRIYWSEKRVLDYLSS
jgi:predicted alpha/beta-fold hydrolase